MTLYEEYMAGKAHCLHCGSVGKVEKSDESGVSLRLIRWDHPDGKYDEEWYFASAPTCCERCWQRELEMRKARYNIAQDINKQSGIEAPKAKPANKRTKR